jgi:hypothetical protein
MSKFRVFETPNKELVVLNEDQPGIVGNDRIPPSPLKEIYSFNSVTIKEYAEAMIPLLFQRLKDNGDVERIYKRLLEESLKEY